MKVYTKIELNDFKQSLTYDDISLIPTQVSRIKSRTEASTNCSFLGLKLNVPVISSPMDSVTGIDMAKELSNLGSLGIVNRFDSSLDSVLNSKNGKGIKSVSIALNTNLNIIEKIAAKNYIICIDTANANNKEVLKKTEMIKKKFDVKIIVGNIAHGASLDQLENAGADAVRVGIGGDLVRPDRHPARCARPGARHRFGQRPIVRRLAADRFRTGHAGASAQPPLHRMDAPHRQQRQFRLGQTGWWVAGRRIPAGRGAGTGLEPVFGSAARVGTDAGGQ